MLTAKILTAVVALALFAGCGGKSDKSAPTGSGKASTGAAPTLTAPAGPIKVDQPMLITWTGPNGPDDYIDVVSSGRPKQVGDEIAYVKTAAGNPAKLNAPPQPGTYDVRYVQDKGERAVLAHIAITVVK